MSGRNEATCLTPDVLAAYFTGDLTETQEIQVEEHLAVCDECTADARTSRDLGEAWARWTPQAHGDAYLRMLLENALEGAQRSATSAGLRERLSRWQARFSAAAEGVVRVVVEETARASHIVTEGLEALLLPAATWKFAPVTPAMRTRGAVRVRGTSDRSSDPVTAVTAAGQPEAHVTVREGREVEVRLNAGPDGQPPPLVILIQDKEDAEPLVREPEHADDTSYWVARFGSLEPGDYLVVFEPSG